VADFCQTLAGADIPDFSVVNVNGDDLPIFNDYFGLLAKAVTGRELGMVSIGPIYWSVRRNIRRVKRKLFSLPVARLFFNNSPSLFVHHEYHKYRQKNIYQNEAAKKLGFAPKYSVQQGIEDMYRR